MWQSFTFTPSANDIENGYYVRWWQNATSSGEYDHYAITDINFYYSGGSSTTEIDVRLNNLPTVAPSEANRLYRDDNGFLKNI